METTVYLIRHSEPLNKDIGEMNISDSVYLINVKNPLSVNGEHLAESISNNKEFTKLAVIYSSNYVRTMATAKYFAIKNNLKINVDERLDERKQGIKNWDELPRDFGQLQFMDENYKIGDGESRKEVTKRMVTVFNDILDKNKGKNILIVSHCNALTFLLTEWCEVNYNNNYKFQNKIFFDGNWKYCQAFKLIFNDSNELKAIKVLN
jgi:broad specificity phosphatase PhoE